jgi:hypothetical protein
MYFFVCFSRLNLEKIICLNFDHIENQYMGDVFVEISCFWLKRVVQNIHILAKRYIIY